MRKFAVTRLAREAFGQFVPVVSFPSPTEIEDRLNADIQRALLEVGAADREMYSTAFLEILAALSKTSTEPSESAHKSVDKIRRLYEELEESPIQEKLTPKSDVYSRLREMIGAISVDEKSNPIAASVLDIYRKSLSERVKVQNRAFAGIEQYLDSVNEFLEGKNSRGYRPFLSMSSTAPVTAAVVAMMRGVNPRLTPRQCKEILQATAHPLVYEGASCPRVVDAGAAVARARDLATAR